MFAAWGAFVCVLDEHYTSVHERLRAVAIRFSYTWRLENDAECGFRRADMIKVVNMWPRKGKNLGHWCSKGTESRNSGPCAADIFTRLAFANDPLSLTFASLEMNRNQKADRDAAEWRLSGCRR